MNRVQTHCRIAALSLAAILMSCGTSDSGRSAIETMVTIDVAALGAPIATITVEVSGAGIDTPLVFNLTVTSGVATGTLTIPTGTARTLLARAYDVSGEITHEGSVTIDVHPGTNPAISIPMIPRPGLQGITAYVGPIVVAVSPATATVAVAATRQLTATVTAAGGVVLSVAVVWASANPAKVTVSPTGLVTGVAAGVTNVVATYGGAAAVSQITVQ